MIRRMTLSDYAASGHWPRSAAPIQMRAVPRGPFAVTTRNLPHRRTHLIDEALSLWKGGQFWRLTVMARCGRHLVSVDVHMEAPDQYELCDTCILADYPSAVVYRFFDDRGWLLYVGCTTNLASRVATHSKSRDSAEWWPLVASNSWVEYADLTTALAAEREAILTERPLFNRDLTARAKLPARRPDRILERAA